MRSHGFFSFLSAVFLSFLVMGASASASEAGRVMIVFDGSGSMWAQIEGKTRIEIARETLTEVMATLPDDLEVGLIAYGHREKGNCADIETIISPARGTGQSISQAVGRITPRGKTPLSEAVKQAAEALKYTESKATVILITDGIETCNMDPCALGNELARLGVDFTTHVVGFAMSREEGQQVACLAENTGGRYFLASNAGELSTALGNAVRASAASPEEVKEARGEASATLELLSEEVRIGEEMQVAWTGPNLANDYIDIVKKGETATTGELSYAYTAYGSPATLRAPGEPGVYDIRYVWDHDGQRDVIATLELEVLDSDVAIIAPQNVVAGSYFIVEWKGPNQPNDYIDVVTRGYTEAMGEIAYAYTQNGNPSEMQAPIDAGAYDIRYILEAPDGRTVLITVPLEVTPTNATLSFPPSVGAGQPISVFWTGPNARNDYVDIVEEGNNEPFGELAYFYTANVEEAGEMIAPETPGRYEVRYILEGPDRRAILARAPLIVE